MILTIPSLNTFSNNLVWVNFITIILSTISLIITWRYIQKIANLYGLIREEYRKKV